MKTCLIGLCILCVGSVMAENYLLNGGQLSDIQYTMEQEFVPVPGIQSLSIGYVIPEDFSSPSYNQDIQKFDVWYSVKPSSSKERIDARGNKVVKVSWKNPQKPIKLRTTILTQNRTELKTIETDAEFPPVNLPRDVRVYLRPTRQVPSDHPEIKRKAAEITSSCDTQFDAVQQILSWIVDRVNYVLLPEDYGAIHSIRTGRGNCQNYSHLAATFMRAVGIPVRIVNGLTLQQPYNIQLSGGYMTMRMAQGRHSWIEVYFPDLGWVPFDPQNMQLFVSNRFIRIEAGLDNNETINDGSIRYRRSTRSGKKPRFEEVINAEFTHDQVQLHAEKQGYGPMKMLFSPPVEAAFTQVVYEASVALPHIIPPMEMATKKFSIPDTMGNLDYPESVDFLSARTLTEDANTDEMVLQKNFLVETAEYVTTEGKRYAQTFILKEPMELSQIGLALHAFGGSGSLWLELHQDDGHGKPGKLISTSEMRAIDTLPRGSGYKWIDFQYPDKEIKLNAGRYWIALAYTGSPILNWFFTYGKPVGPSDGTRYNTLFDATWSHSLSYEFNYRVIGMRSR
ncbi:transglutaminase domain-containing protein [candidate division KSB1 bacterium]|nr:transglutaminase domain-containing protein [candidate division KSB1 bacterium]